mmetsp:Transcript_106801/g.168748  ORF Transcript_106801/g.168748 Transcript_106801/m.168748 type:complete len:187 (+) Transcript_106801:84-644(+)
MGCASSKASPAAPKHADNTLLPATANEKKEEAPKTLAEYAGSVNDVPLADLSATIASLDAANKEKLADAVNGIGTKIAVEVEPVKDEPANEEVVDAVPKDNVEVEPVKDEPVEKEVVEAVTKDNVEVPVTQGAAVQDLVEEPVTQDQADQEEMVEPVTQDVEDPVTTQQVIVESQSANSTSWFCCM